jgi:transposase-like protein
MKIPKQEYTIEFKELSVKRVKSDQSIGAVAKDLGLIEQTLRNCWDNAPTESGFGSFKNERVYGERFETRDEVIAMTFEYIEGYAD